MTPLVEQTRLNEIRRYKTHIIRGSARLIAPLCASYKEVRVPSGSFSLKMPKLSIENRNFVIHQRQDGHGYGTIRKLLQQEKRLTVTKRTIRKLCDKFAATGSVTDKKRVYPCTFGSQEHLEFLNQAVEDEPSATAKELAAKVFDQYNIRVCKTRINDLRRKLGYTNSTPRYCQMIREANKVKRLDFAQRLIAENEQFDVSKNTFNSCYRPHFCENCVTCIISNVI